MQSKCKSGLWLHDFQITRYFRDGVEEVCTRCGQAEFFRYCAPNDNYVAYHIRQMLQKYMPEYHEEYAKR